jgi:hypothetical protein
MHYIPSYAQQMHNSEGVLLIYSSLAVIDNPNEGYHVPGQGKFRIEREMSSQSVVRPIEASTASTDIL